MSFTALSQHSHSIFLLCTAFSYSQHLNSTLKMLSQHALNIFTSFHSIFTATAPLQHYSILRSMLARSTYTAVVLQHIFNIHSTVTVFHSILTASHVPTAFLQHCRPPQHSNSVPQYNSTQLQYFHSMYTAFHLPSIIFTAISQHFHSIAA